MKVRTEKVIDLREWDKLVEETYHRPYSFQQQDGCKGRGNFRFSVPDVEGDDFKNDTVPEIINYEPTMGVSFKAWLSRDPKQTLDGSGDSEHYEADQKVTDQWGIDLWWQRNFYPSVSMIINDLHAKGLLEAGKYTIDIDW